MTAADNLGQLVVHVLPPEMKTVVTRRLAQKQYYTNTLDLRIYHIAASSSLFLFFHTPTPS